MVEQAKLGLYKLGSIKQYFPWILTPSHFSPHQHLEDVAHSFLVLWICDLASVDYACTYNLVEIAQDVAAEIITTQTAFILHKRLANFVQYKSPRTLQEALSNI